VDSSRLFPEALCDDSALEEKLEKIVYCGRIQYNDLRKGDCSSRAVFVSKHVGKDLTSGHSIIHGHYKALLRRGECRGRPCGVSILASARLF
jgi:hypothetical protein